MRRVLSTAEFRDKAERLVFTCPRGREALRGRPAYRGRPIHPQPDRSFLVVYTFDDDSVTLVDVREVPSGPY